MNDPRKSLPEPKFPEHELIRAAAVMPQLSPGLRQRVLKECTSQARLERLKFRAAAAATIAVCGLAGVLLLRQGDSQQPASSGTPFSDQTADRGEFDSRSLSNGEPTSVIPPSVLDAPPTQRPRQDSQEINQMIEELRRREQMLHCALLPFL